MALIWSLLLALLGGLQPAYAGGGGGGGGSGGQVLVTVPQAIDDAAAYILAADGNALTDWDAYALAKAGKTVPASYLSSVSSQLKQNGGVYGNVTDYDRVVLGVKAAGGDPEHVASGLNTYNLVAGIYNNAKLDAQGTNGFIYSLLALGSGTYTIPADAKWTPELIATSLLKAQNTDGSWSLSPGTSSSIDITAAAINALSGYKSLSGVPQAIDKAIAWLSAQQLADGGFVESYAENSESTAQVVWGLVANGMNAADSSSKFAKSGGNPLTNLFSFRQADGGFAHIAGAASHTGATEQVLMALAAYQELMGSNSGSYATVPTTGVVTTPAAASVTVHIVGSAGVIAESAATASTAYDAVIQTLRVANVSYYHESTGHYIDAINTDIAAGSNYWLYNVKRQGSWDYADTNMEGLYDFQLHDGDAIYLYYSASDTALVQSISIDPPQLVAGQALKVEVQQSVFDWVYTNNEVIGAVTDNVYVELGGQKVPTLNGVASFPSGLPAGTYKAVVTGNRGENAPKIVTDSVSVTVSSATAPPPANPVAYLTVIGDSGNVIQSSTSVPLQSGDTPYSVLLRQLGAGRVQSTGAGATAYVQEIDGLRELADGPLSGWMYSVNGSYLSTGADTVYLKAGDFVSWAYTKDGGKDLNASPAGGSGPQTAATTATDPASVADAVKSLGLNYDNQKPIGEVAKFAVVRNADKAMSTDTAAALRQTLAANTVDVRKTAAADSATVVADAASEVQLQIPAGALQASKDITVSKLSSGGSELVSALYEFGPAGQKFDKPVQISIKTPLTAGDLDQLALVWLNEKTGQWIPIPAVIDAETGVVTGLVNHFTKFAVIDKSKVAASADPSAAIGAAIQKAADWLKNGKELSDWSAYALSRAGVAVGADYLASVEAQLKEAGGTFRNVTDYERLALSVQAAGGNAEAIGGYNLIERIYGSERMEAQGSNGPIYALLALNGGAYHIPADAKWTTEKLLQWVLDVQNADGSWPLVKGDAGNSDLTGAALAALTPYKERAAVKIAMDKAVQWLGSVQEADGGFALDGVENTESTAQVLWGLAVSGIDPVSSPFQTSSGMPAYLQGQQLSSGAFPHVHGGDADAMATEQAVMALGSYEVILNASKSGSGAGATPSAAQGSGATVPVYADQADIDDWALPYVQKASAYRIMEGTSGGAAPAFEPKQPVTRIQFVAMLLRILGEAPAADGKTGFADVAPDAWYAGYVAKAVAKGITEGVSADRFAPDAAISRQEMAIMLARALQLKADDAGSTGFSDMDQAYPGAGPVVRAVQQKGLMEGDGSGRFQPLAAATREMAAVVAVRAYELSKKP